MIGRHLLEPWWLRAYRDVPALTVSESSAESLRRLHGWRDVTVVREGHTQHRVPAVPKEPQPTVVFLGRLVGMSGRRTRSMRLEPSHGTTRAPGSG